MVARTAALTPSYNALMTLLEQAQPQIKLLLEEHVVAEDEAEVLIRETLEALFYKWENISSPEYWLIKALEHRCERLAGERRTRSSGDS